MFEVVVTQRAEFDLQGAVDWWRENRSADEAELWYVGILSAIESLSHMPQRCRVIRNAEKFGREVRQLLYGVRSKITHRVYYEIDGQRVVVLRVLATWQSLPDQPEDLA